MGIALLLIVCGQVPDGTLVFSNKDALVGRIAKRVSGGDHYTHIGIVFDRYVYESDWPRSKRTPIASYGKRRATYDYYAPITPYTAQQIANMRACAIRELGKPYRLKNYRRPRSRPTRGTWCSPYVGKVLNAGRRYALSAQNMHEPQNIFNLVAGHHSFVRRVKK